MNVLLVTVDSLRYDRVNERVMPFTRSFADDSLEFTQCVANGPSTPASFPSIHASRHFASIDGLGLPAGGRDIVTLAERLRDAGFATSGYTDNHFTSGSYHFDRGFDTMHDASGSAEAGKLKQFVQSNLDKEGVLFKTIERVYTQVDAMWSTTVGNESEYERAASLNRRALDWIDEREEGEDWFVWLHYMDVHHPYEAPEEYQRQFLGEPVGVADCRRLSRKGTHHPEEVTDEEWELIRNLYDAECAYVDDQFESFMGELDQRGVVDDTTICFTADHGELVGEHGNAGHPAEFWEGTVRVPFILSGVDETGTVEGQIRLLDTAPTLTDAVGLEIPPEWNGESALDVARGTVESREFAFGGVGRQIDYKRCYVRRSDGWKLLRHADDGEFCFDITETPDERPEDDRSGDGVPEYDELSAVLDKHMQEMADLRSGVGGVDEGEEMVEEHLRELGYLE
ncbi:sulfatase-like protein [Haloferax mucosum ATCC BAA-1512]|uniref:Sulfatase-like protein n=1 Tax=Haloferax mucosum ATCC BAA-1512 TaxID=662479 RepID=M0ITU2_9EURY|nr:sulfatase-like hydrolase/transferase [Haloferax mucosum]ELZ98899.1 sulfatase-like protein [Haloferax mucosum ATCC BAA-1512]